MKRWRFMVNLSDATGFCGLQRILHVIELKARKIQTLNVFLRAFSLMPIRYIVV